jgi:hypothetical protein
LTTKTDENLSIYEVSISHRIDRTAFVQATSEEDATNKVMAQVTDLPDFKLISITKTEFDEETLYEHLQDQEMKRVAQLVAEMQADDEVANNTIN